MRRLALLAVLAAVLTVVAAEGKVAEPSTNLHPGGGGNVIDVPALEWLGAQRGPRVWLSDGQAIGIGHAGMGRDARAAQGVAQAIGAARVETLEGTIAALTDGQNRPRGFPAGHVPKVHNPCPYDPREHNERYVGAPW